MSRFSLIVHYTEVYTEVHVVRVQCGYVLCDIITTMYFFMGLVYCIEDSIWAMWTLYRKS